MIYHSTKTQFLNKFDRKMDAACRAVGGQGVSWAADQLRANDSIVTSNLVNALTWSTDKEQGPLRGKKTNGKPLDKPPTRHSVRIGAVVVYAARVEMGFVGKDSLGRYYNQPPKSYLRAGILPHKEEIVSVFITAAQKGTDASD